MIGIDLIYFYLIYLLYLSCLLLLLFILFHFGSDYPSSFLIQFLTFFFFTPLNNPIKYSPTDVLSNEIYTIVNY